MITKFIGMKELRQNMAKISTHAYKQKERIIVLRKNQPIFELRPLSGTDALIESFRQEIVEAHADVRAGKVYSHSEVKSILGL